MLNVDGLSAARRSCEQDRLGWNHDPGSGAAFLACAGRARNRGAARARSDIRDDRFRSQPILRTGGVQSFDEGVQRRANHKGRASASGLRSAGLFCFPGHPQILSILPPSNYLSRTNESPLVLYHLSLLFGEKNIERDGAV